MDRLEDELMDDDIEHRTTHSLGTAAAFPPELVMAVASGMEDPDDAARRFGLSDENWALVREWPPFKAEVANVKAELEKTGYTLRNKMRMMADIANDKLFTMLMADGSPSQMMAAIQMWTKTSGVEKPEQAQTGSGFTITINLPNAPVVSNRLKRSDDDVTDIDPV